MKNSNARYRIAIGMTLFALLLAWWLIPGVNEFMQRSLAAFATLDQQAIERFIDSWGPQAALVSFALMILQAIIAPLPAFLITFANASLFGAFWGGALSWVSAMAGAALCFFIARALGRDAVEKLTGKSVLQSTDGFFYPLRQTHHINLPSAPFRSLRPGELRRRADVNALSPLYAGHRSRPAARDDSLFVDRQPADRRHILAGDRFIDPVCAGDCGGRRESALS